jgi:DNA-directed RNA polymerase specialized sigma24 family protein
MDRQDHYLIPKQPAPFESAVVKEYHRRILKFFCESVGQQEAQDLTQECLLRTIVCMRNYGIKKPRSLTAFVYGVARRLRLEFWRERPLITKGCFDEAIGEFQSLEDTTYAVSVEQIVNRTLMNLCTRDRELLVRRFIRGEDSSLMRRALDVNDSALRTAIHRAKVRFRVNFDRSVPSAKDWNEGYLCF